jgi:hypothetical protein
LTPNAEAGNIINAEALNPTNKKEGRKRERKK